jgi:Cdc6-like AAA superfamily ATPase
MSWLNRPRPTLFGRGGKTRVPYGGATLSLPDDGELRLGALKPRPAEADFPRFHTTASDQPDPRIDTRVAAIRLRLRSAFTPSQPVVDRRMFAGRRALLTSLIRSIEDERLHIILYGDRGVGKTSVLHVLAHAARDARYQVAYVSCGAASTFDDTFRTVAAGLPLMFHKDFGPASPEAERGDTFSTLLDETPVSARQASDLSASVEGTRLLVILDEFDRCEDPGFRRDIAEFLKNLSDRSVRVQIIIAGVAADLAELVELRSKINRNILAVATPRMSSEEVGELVAKGERASGLAFEPDATGWIVWIANGMPYAASLLSQHAALVALHEGRLRVQSDDVAVALDQALTELRGRITRRGWLELSNLIREGGHRLLGPLAGFVQGAGGWLRDTDIDAVFAKPDAERCRDLLEQLASQKALIEVVDDDFGRHYQFFDETAPAYLWFLSAQARFAHSVAGAQERTSAGA